MEFHSRRSAVYGTKGMVASSQPLASEAGLRILREGGNAADAAVAMAAALNVTEPCSTGIGGDAFVLYYEAAAKKVHCILGSGKSPAGLTPEVVASRGIEDRLPLYNGLTVTVPGAAACWHDLNRLHGKLPMAKVLEPGIELAENGFPLGRVTSHLWKEGMPQLLQGGPYATDLMIQDPDGRQRAPREGERFSNPNLAGVFRRLATDGPEGFYKGPVAKAIVEACTAAGGVLTEKDLAEHSSLFEEPICTTYGAHGLQVWEVGPPTQGITALIGLNILDAQRGKDAIPPHPKTGETNLTRGSDAMIAEMHNRIEATRLAFADALTYVADSQVTPVATSALLDKGYAKKRAQGISADKAALCSAGNPTASEGGNETVYFCAVDGEGNGCSMINSNYMGFGTGIVPKGCGFTLHNRGHNFSLDPNHANCLGPSKRPFHTIIPGLCTNGPGATSLANCFGVMGGFMQPQGHIQVISNMYDRGMNPQEALDEPRYMVDNVGDSASDKDVAESKVRLEEGFPSHLVEKLRAKGHNIKQDQAGFTRAEVFGRGQIITRDPQTGVLCGGSDPRADGLAIGFC